MYLQIHRAQPEETVRIQRRIPFGISNRSTVRTTIVRPESK